MVDQGTQQGQQPPGFADASKKLGDRLKVIEQGNIGGSGGFSRGHGRDGAGGRSDYVLLMDDDIRLDPEGILRAATFADLARRPTIVGGHMFSMYDRSLLHAFAEAVEPVQVVVGRRARTPGPGTTSAGATCATPRGCTAAPTRTTTAGGCA